MKLRSNLILLGALATLAVPAALAQGPGAAIYGQKCAMCHGADGKATTPVAKMMQVPSFDTAACRAKSNAALEAMIEKGKGRMPAYQSQLSGAQVKDLVAYIRTLQKK